MKITFYGVRGSVPVTDPNKSKFGGDTSCVHIRLNNNADVILDAGTGIRILGKKLADSKTPIHILLSHKHWDHIQGYPFFEPIFQPNRQIYVYPSQPEIHEKLCTLIDQMDGAYFPIKSANLPSETECVITNIEKALKPHGINILTKALNHPGGGSAYRMEEDGVSCAYVTDNELHHAREVHTSYEEWVEFCHGVNVLIHDGQYVEADMPHKQGWGHSVISHVRQLALDAEVKTLVLFHHDLDRTDAQLEQIQQETESYFETKKVSTKAVCARQGIVLEI